MHTDNIVPAVLCKKCGSQDTRILKGPFVPINYEEIEAIRFERDQLKIRLGKLEQAMQDAMGDPDTILSYKTMKDFQAVLSDWPMQTRDGGGQPLAEFVLVCDNSAETAIYLNGNLIPKDNTCEAWQMSEIAAGRPCTMRTLGVNANVSPRWPERIEDLPQ